MALTMPCHSTTAVMAALDCHVAAAAAMLLQEHNVTLLHAPPGSDFVMGATSQRGLLVWRFNPCAAHRYGVYGI